MLVVRRLDDKRRFVAKAAVYLSGEPQPTARKVHKSCLAHGIGGYARGRDVFASPRSKFISVH